MGGEETRPSVIPTFPHKAKQHVTGRISNIRMDIKRPHSPQQDISPILIHPLHDSHCARHLSPCPHKGLLRVEVRPRQVSPQGWRWPPQLGQHRRRGLPRGSRSRRRTTTPCCGTRQKGLSYVHLHPRLRLPPLMSSPQSRSTPPREGPLPSPKRRSVSRGTLGRPLSRAKVTSIPSMNRMFSDHIADIDLSAIARTSAAVSTSPISRVAVPMV